MAIDRLMEITKRDKALYYILTVLCESVENMSKTAIHNQGYCLVDKKRLNFAEGVCKKVNSMLTLGGEI